MTNKNRQTSHANWKWENKLTPYLFLSSYIYNVKYILRSAEHEVLTYIQLNLNKLNITHDNFPFARSRSLSLLSLKFCICFDFRILISQKRNLGKIRSGEKEVSS